MDTNQQVAFIVDLIREIRVLVGSLESIEALMEDGVVHFRPLLSLARRFFEDLSEAGQVSPEKTAMIREDIELLGEQMDEFEGHKSVFQGLK